MRTDLFDVCSAIEGVLELSGIESVELRGNVIRVKVANGRAFVKMFPNKEEHICEDANDVCPTVKAYHDCFEFRLILTKSEYEEFKKMYGVTEIEVVEE